MMKALLSLLFFGTLASKAQSASEYTFNDGTGLKTWTVEVSTPGYYFRAKEHEIILHPKGEVPTAKNRRILTPRIHLEMDGTISPESIAKTLGASSFKVPQYSKKDLILTYPFASASVDQLPFAQALPGIISARPLLARRRFPKLVPNDPRFAWNNTNTSYQWHLNNTGQNGSVVGIDANLTKVWDEFLGAGVTISVVDDGIQVSHEDLAPNINSDIDHDWNDNSPNDPTPPLRLQGDGTFYSHGTSVAGVIAAKGNNGIGVTGVAPEANLVGLKILADEISPDEEAEALSWRTDVIDISNNSWGEPDDGETSFKADPLVVSALQHSAQNGRDGKGSIFVWSAGNGRAVSDYANYDGYVNQPETIGVGAINFTGEQSYYSESGANVVISAPSDDFDGDPAITTTTLTTDGNYTNLFGGTSSAAPLASGVIALILEANPALGWRDVQEILIRSARRVDSSSPDWSNNGAGFHFHHGYGAGMIDAAAAITLAKTWTNLTNRKQQQFNSPSIDLAIPDENQTGITHTFEVTGEELRVEHVILTVDIDHSYRGDLKIILISPDGTQSILATTSDSPEKGYDNYPLLSVRHWGESSIGNWTLQVIDNFASDAGTLRKATLTLHGTQPRGYRSWVEENFTQEESSNDVISGELADPDLDGRNNLLEYAFAGDPKKSEATLPGEPKIIKSDGQSKVRFTRDLAKSDIQYSLTRSSNLVDSWLKISTTTAITNGTFEVCELILDSSQKQFFRIKISK